MSRLTITAKIWLSIGVFILGYVLSTALGQVQSNQTRASLEVASWPEWKRRACYGQADAQGAKVMFPVC